MKPFVLTGWLIPEFQPDIADIAITPYFKFVWGQLPSDDELAVYLGQRTPDRRPSQGHHWSDFASRWRLSESKRHRNLSLAEFCQQYHSAELWFDSGAGVPLRILAFRKMPQSFLGL